jgi:hypothetical protein
MSDRRVWKPAGKREDPPAPQFKDLVPPQSKKLAIARSCHSHPAIARLFWLWTVSRGRNLAERYVPKLCEFGTFCLGAGLVSRPTAYRLSERLSLEDRVASDGPPYLRIPKPRTIVTREQSPSCGAWIPRGTKLARFVPRGEDPALDNCVRRWSGVCYRAAGIR